MRANYKNAVQGINYEPIYLERLFRNLLLCEQWELKSRYLVINPPAEYAEQPRKDVGNVTGDVGINVGINVGIKVAKILQLIHGNPSISAAKIGEELGISARQAERLLSVLKQKQIIRRIGANKNGHWEIINPSPFHDVKSECRSRWSRATLALVQLCLSRLTMQNYCFLPTCAILCPPTPAICPDK